MKPKKKQPRVKIIFEDGEGNEVVQERELSVTDCETYEDLEKKVVEIEKEAGRFLREEAVKKKSWNWWSRLRRGIRGWFGMGRRK
jgi:hypothetical protein